jgi:hypothetical protein
VGLIACSIHVPFIINVCKVVGIVLVNLFKPSYQICSVRCYGEDNMYTLSHYSGKSDLTKI